MTNPSAPAARKSQTLLRWSAACLAGSAIVTIVATALGGRIPWPLALIVVAGCAGLASDLVRPSRPRVSGYLVLVMAVLSVAAVIVLVVTRP
jgi:hypothetical protein